MAATKRSLSLTASIYTGDLVENYLIKMYCWQVRPLGSEGKKLWMNIINIIAVIKGEVNQIFTTAKVINYVQADAGN